MTIKEKKIAGKRGATLLETLLVLSVILILIASALMYWQSVRNAKLTEQGYELLQDIVEAAQGWQPSHLDEGKYYGISANALLQEGSIPEQYITNFDTKTLHPDVPKIGEINITTNTGLTTPWGGNSQVLVSQAEEADKEGMLKITFLDIPNYACLQLATRINNSSALEHGGKDGADEEKTIFDKAICRTSESKVVNKLAGSTLTVWYHPDF